MRLAYFKLLIIKRLGFFVPYLFLLFFITFASLLEAKSPPPLSPHDVKIKIEEILKNHASYPYTDSQLIIKRTLENFLEELDFSKTYFLESDIAQWLNPSEELLKKTVQGFENERFTEFENIYECLVRAIERRNQFEQEIETLPLPDKAQLSDFKELKWTLSEQELKNRLLEIKSIQAETAEKFDAEAKQQFLYLVNKRRKLREEDLIAHSPLERSHQIAVFILKAYCSALDSQTAYFTPVEAKQFLIKVEQRLFGIGAQLQDEINGFKIVNVVEGSPASQPNKLKVGDHVLAVNGEPVVGMDITDVVELIRGPEGSSVELTILRNSEDKQAQKKEERHVISLVRGEIILKETRISSDESPYGNGIIAHIHLLSFYQDSHTSSSEEIAEIIQNYKKKHNLKGVILDLRDNSGGVLSQAVAVTGLFIHKGIVVSVKDNSQDIHHLRNIEGKPIWDGPLVILTNRASASASEIVAQTLQDYGRALIIGDPETYGKGTFQTFSLEFSNFSKINPKGEYKITRGRYYTVSGKSPQLVGVKPDIVVMGPYGELEVGERYAKFPLETDRISPSFEDDLSDIPLIHRATIAKLYKFNLQQKESLYENLIETLKKNSIIRISDNKNYQNFLKELAKKEAFSPNYQQYGHQDLQLEETLHIMKDLLLLIEQKTKLQESPKKEKGAHPLSAA